jgi:hypothetical protein
VNKCSLNAHHTCSIKIGILYKTSSLVISTILEETSDNAHSPVATLFHIGIIELRGIQGTRTGYKIDVAKFNVQFRLASIDLPANVQGNDDKGGEITLEEDLGVGFGINRGLDSAC